MVDRNEWLKDKRAGSERFLDEGSANYDRDWGRIDPTHAEFVARFLAICPEGGTILDAACGTGKYWPMILDSGRTVVGADRSAGMLAQAQVKFPSVRTSKVSLEALSYRDEFDGAICTDAMESVPPEDWPGVLGNIKRAVRGNGPVYLTVEIEDPAILVQAYEDGKRVAVPIVYGEWAPEGRYHYYPDMEQVRQWLVEAGFSVVAEARAPHGADPYHHFLTRTG